MCWLYFTKSLNQGPGKQCLALKPTLLHCLLGHLGHMLLFLPLGWITSSTTKNFQNGHTKIYALRLAGAEDFRGYTSRDIAIFIFEQHFQTKCWWESVCEKCTEEGKNASDRSVVVLTQTNVCEYFCKTKPPHDIRKRIFKNRGSHLQKEQR